MIGDLSTATSFAKYFHIILVYRESKEAADEALQNKPVKLPKIRKNNAARKGKALKETPKM